MLIEWLEKNTDEMFLAQTEWDRKEKGELEGFATHILMAARTVPVSTVHRLHVNHNAKDVKFN